MNARILLLAIFSTLAMGSASLAQERVPLSFLKNFFNQLQPTSIAQNTEYCGYFGWDENDNIVATPPARGDTDSCLANEPPADVEVFASYHTHAGYAFDADSELPSLNDLEADIDEELDGYLATPGGRIWYNNIDNETASMLCGRNCTVSDPNYDQGGFPPVNSRYSLSQLGERDNIDF